jgi:predicted nucleic acid-binding protein
LDVKDTPFIALALKLNIPIWAEDKKMIEFGLKTGKLRL